ncbi:MAG: hypothetical protein JWN18_410 [Parcubacteria group bacterium]|nr:hypothetical protein [Parcubacteria group bacterium]
MRVKMKVRVCFADAEKMFAAGVRAAALDLVTLAMTSASAWWFLSTDMPDFLVLEKLALAVGWFLVFVALCGGLPEVLKQVWPYWQLALQIYWRESRVGQLSLFPHGDHEVQRPYGPVGREPSKKAVALKPAIN